MGSPRVTRTKALSRNEVMYEIRNTMDGVFSNFRYLAVGFLTEISKFMCTVRSCHESSTTTFHDYVRCLGVENHTVHDDVSPKPVDLDPTQARYESVD